MTNKLRPILLAGGSGTRLWPLSTEDMPKQFIPIFREFSLFDLSLQRLNKSSLFKKPIIVTSERYLGLVNNSLLRTGIEAEKIILEPEAKNTSPAITLAVILGMKVNDSENFLVTPSDHYIALNKNFYDSCIIAKSHLKQEGLILLGVKPNNPSTEYGYISTEVKDDKIKRVNGFIEKPNLDKAKILLKKPGIFWNSGMFIFNGRWYLESLKEIDDSFLTTSQKAVDLGITNDKLFSPDEDTFNKFKKKSFDKAFVEKNITISMVNLNAGWSDLGSWASLGALHGDPDSGMTLYNEEDYNRIIKPWGYYETLMELEESKVKLLSVTPGEKISLQKHAYRTEKWFVIQGDAKVTRGDEELNLQPGDTITIEKNQLHRLENDSKNPLKIIEVQTGSYFGEDDIVRVEDTYGRTDLH